MNQATGSLQRTEYLAEHVCAVCKEATGEELRNYKSDPNAEWTFLAHPSCAYSLGLVEWK